MTTLHDNPTVRKPTNDLKIVGMLQRLNFGRQRLGRIRRIDLHGFLQKHRTAIILLIDQVNSDAGKFGSIRQDSLMDMETIHALSAKGRK